MESNGIAIISIYDSAYYWEVKLPNGEVITRYDYDDDPRKFNKRAFYRALIEGVRYNKTEKAVNVIKQQFHNYNLRYIYIIENGGIEEIKI